MIIGNKKWESKYETGTGQLASLLFRIYPSLQVPVQLTQWTVHQSNISIHNLLYFYTWYIYNEAKCLNITCKSTVKLSPLI